MKAFIKIVVVLVSILAALNLSHSKNEPWHFQYATVDGNLTVDGNTTLSGYLTHKVMWTDIRVPITSTKLGGSKDPGFAVFKTNGAGSQGVFLYWFDAATEEESYFTVQMPHGWDATENVYPHVHWTPKTTADGTPANQKVQWGLEYTWVEIGQDFGNTTIMHASTHIPADENVVAGRHYLTSFGPITASSIQDGLSSMLVCRVFRDAGNATDNYEHDAGLLEIDFHYATNRPGSKGETSR